MGAPATILVVADDPVVRGELVDAVRTVHDTVLGVGSARGATALRGGTHHLAVVVDEDVAGAEMWAALFDCNPAAADGMAVVTAHPALAAAAAEAGMAVMGRPPSARELQTFMRTLRPRPHTAGEASRPAGA